MTRRLQHLARELALRDASAVDNLPRMYIDPATWYDADWWEGRKLYRHDVGGGRYEPRAYAPPAREWHGFGYVTEGLLFALERAACATVIDTLLDIGCGAGSFVAHLRDAGVAAWGIDGSQWAIARPARGAAQYICQWDLRDGPPPDPNDQSDVVTATDVLEHIYEHELDNALRGMVACCRPGGLLFFCVATVARREDEWTHCSPREPIPLEREGTAVSGHVTMRTHDWWIRRLAALRLTPRWDVMHLFAQYWAEHGELRNVVTWGPRFIVAMEKPCHGLG